MEITETIVTARIARIRIFGLDASGHDETDSLETPIMGAKKLYTIPRSRAWILPLVLVIGSLNLPTRALAHGGLEHITGTVTNIGDNNLAVKTTTGKTVQIHVDGKTEYVRGKRAAKISDLNAGDRVAVHAMQTGGLLIAHEVSIGANTKAAKTTVKKAKK